MPLLFLLNYLVLRAKNIPEEILPLKLRLVGPEMGGVNRYDVRIFMLRFITKHRQIIAKCKSNNFWSSTKSS